MVSRLFNCKLYELLTVDLPRCSWRDVILGAEVVEYPFAFQWLVIFLLEPVVLRDIIGEERFWVVSDDQIVVGEQPASLVVPGTVFDHEFDIVFGNNAYRAHAVIVKSLVVGLLDTLQQMQEMAVIATVPKLETRFCLSGGTCEIRSKVHTSSLLQGSSVGAVTITGRRCPC